MNTKDIRSFGCGALVTVNIRMIKAEVEKVRRGHLEEVAVHIRPAETLLRHVDRGVECIGIASAGHPTV